MQGLEGEKGSKKQCSIPTRISTWRAKYQKKGAGPVSVVNFSFKRLNNNNTGYIWAKQIMRQCYSTLL